MRKFVWYILHFFGIDGFIQLSYKGILDEYGWMKSFHARQSINKNGEPIPWMTYSLINFLEPRLTKEMLVFEFGAGNSTLWFSSRVGKVKSVENNLEWYTMLKRMHKNNVELVYKELEPNGEYSHILQSTAEKFDIIVIDGRDRNNCVYNSVEHLKIDGIILFDNSQLKEYVPSQNYLRDRGFKRIDFEGLCPGVAHSNTTTIFYRSDNVLGI
ncbi:MAG: hypothetical protein JXA77_00145 [Bacteroidales bacterium]|nr:hypothetical protein [Bacteroidales bacterium]MBN2821250.1 hypothetical protein [Bacteroidales bacterium]